jgi:hypothetical protein
MTYRLYDVAMHHLQEPESFAIPREEERLSFQPGDIVSIGFLAESAQSPEWSWTRIELAREGGRYIGVLLDRLKTIPALAPGYRIEFAANNILQLYIEEGDHRWVDQSKLSLVSGYIVNDNAWPGKLMRVPPMAPEYSGWVIFNGTETAEYASEFSNFLSTSLQEVVRRYPNVLTVLASPIGSEWLWDHESAEYKFKR